MIAGKKLTPAISAQMNHPAARLFHLSFLYWQAIALEDWVDEQVRERMQSTIQTLKDYFGSHPRIGAQEHLYVASPNTPFMQSAVNYSQPLVQDEDEDANAAFLAEIETEVESQAWKRNEYFGGYEFEAAASENMI